MSYIGIRGVNEVQEVTISLTGNRMTMGYKLETELSVERTKIQDMPAKFALSKC